MEAFKAFCRANPTEEACGLFVLRGGKIEFIGCENVAYDRQNSFLIHPVEFVRHMDSADVIAVGHSHVTAPATPSQEDVINAENCRLPFVIFQVQTTDIGSYEPTGKSQQLIGRRWVLGVSDCYTLARDYYKMQGLELQDVLRNDLKCLFKESLFLKHYEEMGFHDVTGQPPKKHDGLLIQVMSNVPNHAAIVVEDGIILHHLQGRLSCRDPYGGYWRRHTAKLLRHERWL